MTLHLEPISQISRFWADVDRLAKEAFPPEEYLAPGTLVDMAQADNFDFWALTDQGAFVGFMAVQTFVDLAYLFFLAIDPDARSKGYGSRAIETLKAAYPGKKQVVDFEMIDPSAPQPCPAGETKGVLPAQRLSGNRVVSKLPGRGLRGFVHGRRF